MSYQTLCLSFVSAFENSSVSILLGKISAQPHTSLCTQFLDKENNGEKISLPLGLGYCFRIIRGYSEISPS